MSGSTQGPVEETVSATTDGAPLGAAPVSLHLEQPRNGGYTESAFNPLPAADNDLILV